ncbi:unnamed protein product [Vitrella brassicaformis CCMP3155]|uniref:Palmitoyltransferase n=1 Tax=Vitrella brassicaformis (strain CCMP3155) TaxID=1169540 RepID=A0A0G4H1K2_VITBC|nr:unnamed protein product [Vitrella brassicaformis CCMP3155]|eukprot:CEM37378.1 unnamed protein product [Vitrella brassicaformis CCMP3155]
MTSVRERPVTSSGGVADLQKTSSKSGYTDSGEKVFGNSVVLCKGKAITGPDCRTAAVTLTLIVLPNILFHAVTTPWFVREGHPWVPAVAALLAVLTVYFFLRTAIRDPGIIPRQRDAKNAFDRWKMGEDTHGFRTRPPPRFQDEVYHCHPIRVKYCTTCNIYRPPRAVHCSICDNCVERFDHHCPWVGNCVGKRNYKSFYLFVLSVSLLDMFILATCTVKLYYVVVDLEDQHDSSLAVFKGIWALATDAMLLMLYCLAAWFFVVGLCFYHSYLILTNQTTYEQIKNFYVDHSNPFNRGPCGNLFRLLCKRVRPTYFDPGSPKLPTLYEPRTDEYEMRIFRNVPSLPTHPTNGLDGSSADISREDLNRSNNNSRPIVVHEASADESGHAHLGGGHFHHHHHRRAAGGGPTGPRSHNCGMLPPFVLPPEDFLDRKEDIDGFELDDAEGPFALNVSSSDCPDVLEEAPDVNVTVTHPQEPPLSLHSSLPPAASRPSPTPPRPPGDRDRPPTSLVPPPLSDSQYVGYEGGSGGAATQSSANMSVEVGSEGGRDLRDLEGLSQADNDNITISPTPSQTQLVPQKQPSQSDDAAADSPDTVPAADSCPPAASESSPSPSSPDRRLVRQIPAAMGSQQQAVASRAESRNTPLTMEDRDMLAATDEQKRGGPAAALGAAVGMQPPIETALVAVHQSMDMRGGDADACLTPPGDEIALPSMNVIEVFIDEN